MPWLGVAETNVRPAGNRSCTVTFVAVFGPRSVRVTVNDTVSPTLGVGLLTVLPRARSACCGVSVALPLLLEAFESAWSRRLRAAVLVSWLELTTRAWMVRVLGAVVVTVPTVQTPVLEL